MLPKINKVVAVQNYGISGTTLIQSLLDNHPQIVSLPMLHAEPLYRVWDRILAEGAVGNIEKMAGLLKGMIPFLFDVDAGADASLKQMGEEKNEIIEVDEKVFFAHFEKILSAENISRRSFIISVYLAYNACYGNEFSDDALICFPIHSQDKKYAEYLLADFKEVYFLHMVREPVQNMGSLIKHISHGQIKASLFKSLLGCAVQQIIFEKMYHWQGYVPLHGKKPYFADFAANGRSCESRAVRLEDIHLNSEFTLTKITQWFGVKWHDNLMKSTFMGKLWHNRVESIRVSGFNKQVISQQHDQYLNSFDKFRLRLLTKVEQKSFGYRKCNIFDQISFIFLPLLVLLPFRVDFNLKRLAFRLEGLRGLHSEDGKSMILDIFFYHLPEKEVRDFFPKKFFSVTEWAVFDIMNNTKEGAYISSAAKEPYDSGQIFLALLSLPFFLLRIVANYLFLRCLMIMVWRMVLFSNKNSEGYVMMLYSTKDLQPNKK